MHRVHEPKWRGSRGTPPLLQSRAAAPCRYSFAEIMTCCVDPSEPRVVRRARALAVLQLGCEVIALFLSLASTADGGAVGSVAAMCGLGAAVAGLVKNLRYRQAFSLVSLLNFVGGMLGLAQCSVIVQRYVTIDEWCCMPTTNKSAMRAFLLVLTLLFLFDALLRLVITACVAMPARYAPDAGLVWPHGAGSSSRAMQQEQELSRAASTVPVVAMGVPIAEPTAVVAAASSAADSGGSEPRVGPEVECIDGQVPEVISAVAAQHRPQQ